MAPIGVIEWLRQTYPKPTIDPEWLDACLAWISTELQFNDPITQAEEIISNVDSQLLNSDLRDSMLAGTGFPDGISTAENALLKGRCLVQIQGITDIGHSAFSLQNIQQTRLDRKDLEELVECNDEDEGPIPKYPRGMLRFDLSDGSKSLRAIEYRRMSELDLGVTPLGFKMIIKDVPVRQGIAFLEPSNVILKGYMTEELDSNREVDFARGLCMRLGQSELEPEDVHTQPTEPPWPPRSGLSTANFPRTPLREMTKDDPVLQPPRPPAREELEPPTRRRVPTTSASTSASASTTVASPYFTNTTSTLATLTPSVDLAAVPPSPVHVACLLANKTSPADDTFEFSDDIPIDDAFLQELEAAEQAVINTVQQREHNSGRAVRGTRDTNVTEQNEVIVIDSDEDDKENLAPFSPRRVRQRIATDEVSDIIVIE